MERNVYFESMEVKGTKRLQHFMVKGEVLVSEKRRVQKKGLAADFIIITHAELGM